MRKVRVRTMAVAGLFSLVTLVGCSAGEPEAEPPEQTSSSPSTPTATPSPRPTTVCPPTPIDVAIDYQLAQVSGGVQVSATTNLPDGAELMVSFFREDPSYFGQDTQVVTNGTIVSEPFGDDGSPLAGGYDLGISLSISRTQPDAIQSCIGPHGENLTGPLVQLDQFGEQWVSLDVPVVF